MLPIAETPGGAREEGRGAGEERGGAQGVSVQRPGQQLAAAAELHALQTLLLPRHQRGHPSGVPGDSQETLLSLVM